jgi:IstB-like ATP binding protein/Methyltransferase domain
VAARSLPKLADRARAEEWSYERTAEALLQTEVVSREASGGEQRIKAARFPARKTLEEFDFSFQTSVRKTLIQHLGQLDFLQAKENVVLSARPAPARHTSRSRSRSVPSSAATGCSADSPADPGPGRHRAQRQMAIGIPSTGCHRTSAGSWRECRPEAAGRWTLAAGRGLSGPPTSRGYEYVNVDIAAQGPGAVLADAQDLPFADCSFDLVISSDSLEHFHDSSKRFARSGEF